MGFSKLLIVVSMGGALALTGCGDDDGPGGGDDAGTGGDAGPGGVMDDDLPAAQTGTMLLGRCSGGSTDCQMVDPATAMPADFSCRGMNTQPPDTEAVIDFGLQIRDFQEDNDVPDTCVKFYGDNIVPPTDTCDPASDPITDAMGILPVQDNAGSWYAYRVFEQMGPTPATTIVGSVQYNESAPSMGGGTAEGNSVSQATINLIPTVLGFRRVEGTAVLAGTITDCMDDNVYGTRIRVYTASGELVAEGMRGSDPHYRYFDGDDFPNGTQPWSHIDGLFAAANLPASNEPIFMELWGKLTPDGDPELLGCESGTLFADTVTILNIGPLRSDGPACPNVM